MSQGEKQRRDEALVRCDFASLVIDNRGIGQSVPCTASISIEAMAEDVVAVMREVGWESAHVIGQKMEQTAPGKLTTPLMMLQDATQSKVLLVTLAETSPVSEAAALQDDLRRASIEPYGWVVNRSLAASSPSDPVLVARAANEQEQFQRIMNGLATRVAILPLMPDEPVGIPLLEQLLDEDGKGE